MSDKTLISLTIFTLSVLAVNAQEVEMQHITLKDTSIINNIRKVVHEGETDKGLEYLKQGKGYIHLGYQDYLKGDTVGSYQLTESINQLPKELTNYFPIFYSELDGMPVLIYLSNTSLLGDIKLSSKSEAKLRELIEPRLSPKFVFKAVNTKTHHEVVDSIRSDYISFYKEFRRFYVIGKRRKLAK